MTSATAAATASAALAFFQTEEQTHEKKVAGLAIDPRVTEAKVGLRKLKAVLEQVGKCYSKFALAKRATLELPDLLVWARSDTFFGHNEAAGSLHSDATKVQAIAKCQADAKAQLLEGVVAGMKKAEDFVAAAIGGVYMYELSVRDAVKGQEAAAKALKAATTALGKAEDNVTKAAEAVAKAAEGGAGG